MAICVVILYSEAYKAQIVKNTPAKDSSQPKKNATTKKDKGESRKTIEDDVALADDAEQASTASTIVSEEITKEEPVVPKAQLKRINYASEDKGAVIMDHHKEGKNGGNILNENADKYFHSPCSGRRWIVLQLSEDVSNGAM